MAHIQIFLMLIHHSKLMEICKVLVAHPETQSFRAFVENIMEEYQSQYSGYVVMEAATRLQLGIETAPLRRAAIAANGGPSSSWRTWTDGVESGQVWVVGKWKHLFVVEWSFAGMNHGSSLEVPVFVEIELRLAV